VSRPLDKAGELAILDSAIRQLGEDSYLGPWLAQVRAEVENCIRSDYFPELTLGGAEQKSFDTIARAQTRAGEIIEQAKANAARIEASAVRYQAEICENIRQALRDLNNH